MSTQAVPLTEQEVEEIRQGLAEIERGDTLMLEQVRFSRLAERAFRKLAPSRRQRVLQRIEQLRADPYDPELSTTLEVVEGVHCTQVDGCRIVYAGKENEETLSIVAVHCAEGEKSWTG